MPNFLRRRRQAQLPQDVRNGLFLAYDAPLVSGATAMDESGAHNNGAITGALLQNGAWQYDGVDDIITVPHDARMFQLPLTVVALVEFTTTPQQAPNSPFIFNKVAPGSTYSSSWSLYGSHGSGKINFAVYDASNNAHIVIADAPVVAGTAYCVVGRITAAGEVSLWCNGVKQAITATTSNLWTASAGALSIGSAGASWTLGGRLAGVRLYSRALTDAEIGQLYARVQPQLAAMTITPSAVNTVVWAGTSSPTLTRATPVVSANGRPWDAIQLCNVQDDGTIPYRFGDAGFDRTGAHGQVMADIPLFHYGVVYDNTRGTWQWSVSRQPFAGSQPHPAFVRHGTVVPHIYLGSYDASLDANSKLQSITGVMPLVSKTRAQFRTYARARGAGWGQLDFSTYSALQLLMLAEYGTFDMQAAIGQGNVSTSAAIASGANDSLGNGSGYIGTNGHVPVSYRGIENLWGNVWQFVDGASISNWALYLCNNPSQYTDDVFADPYTSVGITGPHTNGWVGKFGFSSTCDWVLWPSSVSGPLSGVDYYYQNSGSRVVFAGGGWSHGSLAGPWNWYVYFASSDSYADVGGRLLYIP